MSAPLALHLVAGAGVLVVRGTDTWSFLQSLVSQDLDPLSAGAGAHSLLLSPEGRLVADFRVLCVGDEEAWLDTAPGVAPALVEGLRRFLIRVDVALDDRSGAWGALVVRGDAARDVVAAQLGVAVEDRRHAHTAWGEGRVVSAAWPGDPGVDVLAPVEALGRARDQLRATGVAELDEDGLEARRIVAGVPRQGRDVDDRTIPQEARLHTDAVSFTKGCFVGQELVCRIDRRGANTPRHLEGVRVEGETVPPPGATLWSGGDEVGVVTSSATHQAHGVVALAMVRRSLSVPADVDVRWPGHTPRAHVLPLPGEAS